MIKKTASEIWAEYERDRAYKNSLKLPETVKLNNQFYEGNQWVGLEAPDLQKPVLNILKRSVKYYISMIVSDDIGISIEDFDDQEDSKRLEEILKNEIDKVFEKNRFGQKIREGIRNCSVDGDLAMYLYVDDVPASSVTVQRSDMTAEEVEVAGKIKMELVDNLNVHFANVVESDVQEQPYIILSFRKYIDDVKREVEELGGKSDNIQPDSDMAGTLEESDKYVTVLLKMWKEKGTIKAIKCTQQDIIKEEWDLELPLYPLAWMNWERRKNSYHGVAAITAEIPNQTFINKMLAMGMRFQMLYAFPKVYYDRAKFPSGLNNNIGQAVAVTGNPNDAIYIASQPPMMNGQALDLVNMTIDKTKDVLGVYDAALGNVRPENTSAIIATQRAASQPLELQKMDLYQLVEDVVRIVVEMMANSYGMRNVRQSMPFVGESGKVEYVSQMAIFDFAEVAKIKDRVRVDIGGSSYWSELTQIQTLDNLMQMGIIPDALTYLEAIPDGFIKNKSEISEAVKEKQEEQKMMQAAQQMPIDRMAEAQPPEMMENQVMM